MRKLMVGLVAVALLAVAAPAIAQQADPLGLISSGAVLPYVGQGNIAPGSISFLEVASPVGPSGSLHAFFFNVACNRGPSSVGLGLTTNDVRVQRIDNVAAGTPQANPPDGLIALGGASPDGFHLAPIGPFGGNSFGFPIHARVLWANAAQNYIRTLTPIAISNFDAQLQYAPALGGITSTNTPLTWNPLRTAATFWAPPELGPFNTTIYFVCPDSNIVGPPTKDLFAANSPVFPAGFANNVKGDFPQLIPPAQTHGLNTPLDARIYDTDEHFLINVHFDCSCLTKKGVTEIHPVYADGSQAPNGTYTEVEGGTTFAFPKNCTQEGEADPSAPCNHFSFTGFRAIRVAATPVTLDNFGRLSNGNVCSIRGDFSVLCLDPVTGLGGNNNSWFR